MLFYWISICSFLFAALYFDKHFRSHFGTTLYHPVGTAAMGTVLDSKLRYIHIIHRKPCTILLPWLLQSSTRNYAGTLHCFGIFLCHPVGAMGTVLDSNFRRFFFFLNVCTMYAYQIFSFFTLF